MSIKNSGDLKSNKYVESTKFQPITKEDYSNKIESIIQECRGLCLDFELLDNKTRILALLVNVLDFMETIKQYVEKR